ncbi:MAG TPA: hypothetical protein P5110_05475 [Candidatus Omnitrophota bacterium]|nr:hypothetical protein [Candidatus Omnitrophota bacterium]
MTRIPWQDRSGVRLAGALVCLLLLTGWERVDLGEFLAQQKAQQAAPGGQAETAENLTPYRILEKMTYAYSSLESVDVNLEVWIENPLLHMKIDSINYIHNVDDYKSDGKVSVSLLLPYSASTSRWVQTYNWKGIPFTWDWEEREWKTEELEISDKQLNRALAYGLFHSLFTVKTDNVDLETIRFLGIEKRRNKDCYVLQYDQDPRMFKRWETVGSINTKLWIDKETFLPVIMRAEGSISDVYLLQQVEYSHYNASPELVLPLAVVEKVKQERAILEKKALRFPAEIGAIRGWQAPDTIPFTYLDRVQVKKDMERLFDQEYTPEKLQQEEFIFKWLGLLHKDADYRISAINSEIDGIAAYYDPAGKRIVMGDWLHPMFAEAVLVHEMTHYLQDALFDTENYRKKAELKNNEDAMMAYRAVLEGEATAVMLEYLLKKDKKDFKSLPDVAGQIEKDLLREEAFTRDNVYYNLYTYGTAFMQACLRSHDWKWLDELYKAPPLSMRQILHASDYIDAERLPTTAAALRVPVLPPGWQTIYSNRLGEFLIDQSLRQFLSRDRAEDCAQGWKDDTLCAHVNAAGARCVTFWTKWDSQEDAEEFFKGYADWLRKKFAAAQFEDKPGYVCAALEDNEFFFCSRDADVVCIFWSRGVNRQEAESLSAQVAVGLKTEK